MAIVTICKWNHVYFVHIVSIVGRKHHRRFSGTQASRPPRTPLPAQQKSRSPAKFPTDLRSVRLFTDRIVNNNMCHQLENKTLHASSMSQLHLWRSSPYHGRCLTSKPQHHTHLAHLHFYYILTTECDAACTGLKWRWLETTCVIVITR